MDGLIHGYVDVKIDGFKGKQIYTEMDRWLEVWIIDKWINVFMDR